MVPPSAGSTGSPGVPDMRSALRRGTGAGGTSDGRGGIEGEPIPLDSRDPRYSDYLDRIRRMIKEKWGYPCVKNGSTHECEYKTALLVIEFGIARDGKVPFVNVVRTSGFQIYDDYAVNAIKFAQPFPRVPDSMGSRAGIPIVATFSYQVDTSLVNLLR
jgi:TonB family protein